MGDLQALWRDDRARAWHVLARVARERATPRRRSHAQPAPPGPRGARIDEWVSELLVRAADRDGAALRRARPQTEIGAWIAGVRRRVDLEGLRAHRRTIAPPRGTPRAARARALALFLTQFPEATWGVLIARQRQVMRHLYVGRLAFHRVATLLGVSKSSIRKRHRAAVERLRGWRRSSRGRADAAWGAAPARAAGPTAPPGTPRASRRG